MYRYYRIEIQSSYQTVSKPVSLYLYLYHHPSPHPVLRLDLSTAPCCSCADPVSVGSRFCAVEAGASV